MDQRSLATGIQSRMHSIGEPYLGFWWQLAPVVILSLPDSNGFAEAMQRPFFLALKDGASGKNSR
jgi:hypothetical protein